MPIELWPPRDLYDLRVDDRNDGTPGFFDNFYVRDHFAQDGEVRFGDLEEADRFLAPFVLPYEQGKPLDTRKSEKIEAFRLPYTKVKSPVRPTEVKNLNPSDIFRNGGQRPSPEQLFDARVAELDDLHRRMIANREAWMRARAIIDGRLLIEYDRDQGAKDPTVELNFGRDEDLTIVKTADFWNDPNADILGDLESWMKRQYLAFGGGSTSQLIVGAQVAPVFRRNNGIKEMLDTRYRGNDDVVIRQGIMRANQPLNYIGQLTTGLEVWSYKDTFDIPTADGGKARVDILNEKDVLMLAPGVSGVEVRGTIFDAEALQNGLWAESVFAKQWMTQDPGEYWQMHQASYLPIPMYPNRTARARVLA